MSRKLSPKQMDARRAIQRGEDDFDPGATLCGHGPRHPTRSHYLGGGLWVCFECLVKTLGRSGPRTQGKT